jgi:hypothetical protein
MTDVLLPDATGHFGPFGGRFIPEALVAALDELDAAYRAAKADPAFVAEFDAMLRDYAGSAPRPARGSCSSARTCCTPARTRSATCSARRCSPSAWASAG